MDDLISVIVPVYKVEKYLNRCIDSIINQTYRNIEVILVDDGSPDKCGEICDAYAAMDNRIIVIHKKNGGLSSARNIGLEQAKGRYVAFVDSDDCISKEMMQVLHNAIKENNATIAACQYLPITEDMKYESISFAISDENPVIWTEEEALIQVNKCRLQVWNKLYDSELVKDKRFIEGIQFEDIDFTGKCLSSMKYLVYVDAKLYGYTVAREGSTVSAYGAMRVAGLGQMRDFASKVKDKGYLEALPQVCALFEGLYVSNYFDACRLKVSNEIKHKIVSEFESTYELANYKRRAYIELFHISPKLTYLLWKTAQLRKTVRK